MGGLLGVARQLADPMDRLPAFVLQAECFSLKIMQDQEELASLPQAYLLQQSRL